MILLAVHQADLLILRHYLLLFFVPYGDHDPTVI